MVIARGLGLAFSLVLARYFLPSDYGRIQYAIVLAEIIAIGTQPFTQHTIARFIGKYSQSQNELDQYNSNSAVILVGLFVGSLMLAIPVLFLLGKWDLGVIIIYIGVTLFYTYWGLARGYMASGRLVVAYLASNILQLVLLIFFVQVFHIKSSLLAMIFYAGSYVLPIFLLQRYDPFPVRLKTSLINRETASTIIKFSIPIWLSHAAYIVYFSIDMLFMEQYSDLAAVGRYSLIRNICTLFYFVPTGISILLMPKIASLPENQHNKLLIQMLLLTFLANGIILLGYIFFGGWMVQTFFGSAYVTSTLVMTLLAIGMILFGVHGLITAVYVGSGKAKYETYSRFVAAFVSVAIAWLMVPKTGALGAAMAVAGGAVAGMMVYLVIMIINRRSQP